ncbi:Solute carrier organic anion transporter family member [Aphelenchoides besseyi]|nr:Solute carrier organic anion transporter family member [Aphelenchoides besseyi]
MALKVNLDRTVISFFVLFLVVYFLESIGGFFMTSAIVAIEKQFQIPSKISGMMVSASDFGYIPTVVFVAYMGGKGNRAKWIGGGCMLIAVANLIISSSNFLFPVQRIDLNNSAFSTSIERDLDRLPQGVGALLPKLPASARHELQTKGTYTFFENCDLLAERNQSNDDCIAVQNLLSRENPATLTDIQNLRIVSATTFAFCDRALNQLRRMIEEIRCNRHTSNAGPTATIFGGLLLLGVGRTMPFSLGLPLVDDNVRKSNLPIYFAGMFFIRLLGPVVGLMLGAFFNKFYYTLETPRGLSPRDPAWAGFLLLGAVLFFPSLGLFCFKEPPQSEEEDYEKDVETKEELLDSEGNRKPKQRNRKLALVDRHIEKNADGKTMPNSLSGKFNDFAATVRSVLKQPIYVFMLCGRIIDVLAFKGFFIFLPKYLEIQFGIPQYKVNLYMGIMGVVGFAIGITGGSLLMKVFKLEGRKAAIFVAVCSLLAGFASFLNAGVGCTSTLTALGKNPQNALTTTGSCASACYCEEAPLYPVCDEQGRVYYSPCHAGCAAPNITAFVALDSKSIPTFENCRCIGETKDPLRRVSRDFCDETDCNSKVKLYFINMMVSGAIGGLGVTPAMLILLRSVPAKHRSLALGFNGFVVSMLATLPSPVVWGAVVDWFCIRWDQKCDGKGACSLYATDELRVWLHCLYGILRLLATIFDLCVVYHARGLKILSEEKDQEDDIELEEKSKNFESAERIPAIVPDQSETKTEKKSHKRSSSKDIRSLLSEDGGHNGRRSSRHSMDHAATEIASLTSNKVV